MKKIFWMFLALVALAGCTKDDGGSDSGSDDTTQNDDNNDGDGSGDGSGDVTITVGGGGTIDSFDDDDEKDEIEAL